MIATISRRVKDWARAEGRPGSTPLARARAGLLEQFRLPLHRNGYALLFGAGTTSVLGLAYWVLAARLYPAAVVGLNSALLSAVLFLSGLGQLGVNAALIRFIPQAGRQAGRWILIGYLFAAGIAGLACVIFYIGIAWWAPALSFVTSNAVWKWSVLAAVIGWCLFSLQDNVLTGLRQAVWVPVENTLFAIAKIVLLVALAGAAPAFGILLSWMVPAVLLIPPVSLLIFGRLIPAHGAQPPETQPPAAPRPVAPRQMLDFAAGNFVGSLFFVIYNTLLPIMVTDLAGATANAYFYLPWTIATSIQLIGLSLASSLVVEAALDQSRLRDYCKRILVTSFGLLIPLGLVLVIGARFFLQIYGAAYADQGTLLLGLLVVAAVPATLVAVAVGIMRAQNRNRQIVVSQGALCAAALGLAYVLLPRYGINGVGVAWLIAQAATAAYLLVTEFWPLFRRPAAAEAGMP